MSNPDTDPGGPAGGFRMKMVAAVATVAALAGMIGIATAATSSGSEATTPAQAAPTATPNGDGTGRPCPHDGAQTTPSAPTGTTTGGV
jgi:hypothetical protein